VPNFELFNKFASGSSCVSLTGFWT